jgi:hypothetical protein
VSIFKQSIDKRSLIEMLAFEISAIWRRTLAPQTGDDPYAVPRAKLRVAFLRFREKAALLASEIGRDLPDRTVHDVTHLDALWGIADIIIGDGYPMTPAEAFVLGGAFLVHDLAMSRAAYPEGLKSVREEPAWRDSVAAILKTQLGRTPMEDEIKGAPEAVANRATEEVMVDSHGV